MGNADVISRLPLEAGSDDNPDPNPPEVLLLEAVQDAPIRAEQIALETEKDAIHGKVLNWTEKGWPESAINDQSFQPFQVRRNELSLMKGCILWGNRVVIPPTLQASVMSALHAGHAGIMRTKALARSYVWWPGIDSDIENTVSRCRSRQMTRNMPPREAPHPWIPPSRPWSRDHLDYAGPFYGRNFLVGVDTYSRWPEVTQVSSLSATELIKHLRRMFATHGLPEVIVTDNGTSLASAEMREFTKLNGIQHVFTPVYHPASNGSAERMVQTVKSGLSRLQRSDWECRLSRLLFSLRSTPSATTGKTPAEIMFGRRLRVRLDPLRPANDRQQDLKLPMAARRFSRGDTVFVRSYRGADKWCSATITATEGSCIYRVRRSDGLEHRVHVNPIRRRQTSGVGPRQTDSADDFLPLPPSHAGSLGASTTTIEDAPPPLRRSSRERHPTFFYGCPIPHSGGKGLLCIGLGCQPKQGSVRRKKREDRRFMALNSDWTLRRHLPAAWSQSVRASRTETFSVIA
ncbi:uncharacterized protein K02A2.6-like [Ornithodoros turicata]|uniref:uncharacterized protein K02A2.6-like n=1 Tax=Ornithodoros turicata TaxID=34597 RepID=UPI003139EA4C